MRTFNHVRRSLLLVLLLTLLAFVISAALSIALVNIDQLARERERTTELLAPGLRPEVSGSNYNTPSTLTASSTGHEEYWNALARAKQAEIDPKAAQAKNHPANPSNRNHYPPKRNHPRNQKRNHRNQQRNH
jgi:hypothetical protein